MLQKANEVIRGITADPIRKTYWVYTDQSLFELSVRNEDRDVWKILLSQGKYEPALQYAKVSMSRKFSVLPYENWLCRPPVKGISSLQRKPAHISMKDGTSKQHNLTLNARSLLKKLH